MTSRGDKQPKREHWKPAGTFDRPLDAAQVAADVRRVTVGLEVKMLFQEAAQVPAFVRLRGEDYHEAWTPLAEWGRREVVIEMARPVRWRRPVD